jgi:kynurenine formamidase
MEDVMPKLTRDDVLKKAEELKNWGKWGPDDELGVLNYVTPADIVNAAKLVRKGKTFALGLPLDENGPQRGIFGGRWNPLHQMLATGTDAVAGKHDVTPGLRYADDAINLPTQAGTQLDALAHVFIGDKMWNGYPATLVDSKGAHKNGIEKFANKVVGRGVLLDVARFKGVACLEDGYGITVADLDATAKRQGVEVRRADFVLVRTGQMEDRLQKGEWGGYAGGDAPGLAFETLDWIHAKQIAGIGSDTWGIEVRPNATGKDVFQPWHWVTIPAIGIVHHEILYVKDLAADCAADGVYEFFYVAPPLVITGGTGSPVNPQAIK